MRDNNWNLHLAIGIPVTDLLEDQGPVKRLQCLQELHQPGKKGCN